MTKVGRIGWGVTPPPEPPVVVMPVGGRVTPVPPDDGITIPPRPEDAKEIRGGVLPHETEDGDEGVVVTIATSETAAPDGQAELRFSGGWLTGHE